MPDRKQYLRDVMMAIMDLQDETGNATKDFKEEGIVGSIRRAALDEMINQTLPKEAVDLINVLGTVGVTASQTAQAIAIYNLKINPDA